MEKTKLEEKDELTASLVEEEKFDDDFEDEPEKKSDDSSVKVIVNPMTDYIYEAIQNESDDSLMTGSADTFPTETETETINDKVEAIAEDEMAESTVFITHEKTPEEQSKEESPDSINSVDPYEVAEDELEPVIEDEEEIVENEEPNEVAESVEEVENADMIETEEMAETIEIDQLEAIEAHIADNELDAKSETTQVADETEAADVVDESNDIVDAIIEDTDDNKDEFKIDDFEPSPRAIVSEETRPSGMTSEIVLEPHVAQTPLLDQALDSEVIDENEIYNIVNEVDQLVNQITSVSDNVEIISDEVQTFTDVIGDIENSIKKSLSGEIHQSSGSESPVTEGPDEISENEDDENGIDVESVTVADVIDNKHVEADFTDGLSIADKQSDFETGTVIIEADTVEADKFLVDKHVSDETAVKEEYIVEPVTEMPAMNIDEQGAEKDAQVIVEKEPVTEESFVESFTTLESAAETSLAENYVEVDPKIELPVANQLVTDEPVTVVPDVDETESKVVEETIAVETSTEELVTKAPVVEDQVAGEEPAFVELSTNNQFSEELATVELVVTELVNENPVSVETVADKTQTDEEIIEESVNKDSLTEDQVPVEMVAEENITQDRASESVVKEESVVENTVLKEVVTEVEVIDEVTVDNIVHDELVIEEHVTPEAHPETSVCIETDIDEVVDTSIAEEQLTESFVLEEPVSDTQVAEESATKGPIVKSTDKCFSLEREIDQLSYSTDVHHTDEVTEIIADILDASPLAPDAADLSERSDQIETEGVVIAESATPAKVVTFEDEITTTVENIITEQDDVDQIVEVLSDAIEHVEIDDENNSALAKNSVQESPNEVVEAVVVKTSALDGTQSENVSNKNFVSPTGEIDTALTADVIYGKFIAEKAQTPVLNESEHTEDENMMDDSSAGRDTEIILTEDKPSTVQSSTSNQPADDESNELESESAIEEVEILAERNLDLDLVTKDNEEVTVGDQIDHVSITDEPALVDDEINIKSDDMVVDNETRSNSDFETCATSLTEKDEESPCVTGDNIDDEDEVQVATNESDKYERVINGELTENTENDISSTALDDSEKHFESKLDAVSDVSDIEEMTDIDAVCDTIVNQLGNDQSVIENQAIIEQTTTEEKHDLVDISPVSLQSELHDSSPDIITEELTTSSKTESKPVEEVITVTTQDDTEPTKCNETEQQQVKTNEVSDIVIHQTTDIIEIDSIDQNTVEPVIVNEEKNETNLEVELETELPNEVNDSACDNNDVVADHLEQSDNEEQAAEQVENKIETESFPVEGEKKVDQEIVAIDGAEVELASGKLLEEILKVSDDIEIDVDYKTDANAEATENDISSAAFDDSYPAEQSIKSRQLDATIVSDTSDVDEMTDTDTTEGVCETIDEESEPNTKVEEIAKEPSSSSENDSLVFKKLEKDLVAPIAQSTPKSPIFMDDILGGLNNQEREVQREEKSPVESESNGTDTTSVATTVLPVNEKQEADNMDSSSVLSYSEVDNSTAEIKTVENELESVTQDDKLTVDEKKAPTESDNENDNSSDIAAVEKIAVNEKEPSFDEKSLIDTNAADISEPVNDGVIINLVSEYQNDEKIEEMFTEVIQPTPDSVESNIETIVENEPQQDEVIETESKACIDTKNIEVSTEILVKSPVKDMAVDDSVEREESYDQASTEQTVEIITSKNSNVNATPVEVISKTVDDIIDAIADADPVVIAETLTDSVIQDLNQVNEIMDSPGTSVNSSEKPSEAEESVDATESVEAKHVDATKDKKKVPVEQEKERMLEQSIEVVDDVSVEHSREINIETTGLVVNQSN